MADAQTQQRYRLDTQVGYLLRLANQRHSGIFQAHMTADLTPTQFAALARLDEHGPCSQNQLGRLAAMDIATIKGVVDRLVEKGLVTRAPSPEDKRRAILSLSPKGREMMPSLQSAGHAITADTLTPLTPSEQRQLLALLKRLA